MKLLKDILVMISKSLIVTIMGLVFVLAYAGIVWMYGGNIPENTAIYSNCALLVGFAVGALVVK